MSQLILTAPQATEPAEHRKNRLRSDVLLPPELAAICARPSQYGPLSLRDLCRALVVEMVGDDARVTVSLGWTSDTDRRTRSAVVTAWVDRDATPILIDSEGEPHHAFYRDQYADSDHKVACLLIRELFALGADGLTPALYTYDGSTTPDAVHDAIAAWRKS